MTEQEAKKIIGKIALDRVSGEELEAMNIALKSLEKQIPKQVIHEHHCPECGNGLPAEKITEDYCSCCFKWKHCPNCGQAIKWE